MVKFTNLDSFIIKEREILIRFEKYKIKSPTVNEWLLIQNLDFSEAEYLRDITKKITEILIPTLPDDIFNSLTTFELYNIACTCLDSKLQKEEENSNSDSNLDLNDDIEIAFDYLIVKMCKYLNMNLNEVLNLDFNIFLNILKVLEVVKAEEALTYCELTHVVLDSENGRNNYKEMIEKYRRTFKKGVKTIEKLDVSKLIKLKSMLEGGK